MAQFHVVTRPFEGQRPFEVGELVDAEGWKYMRQLAERRYIRPATLAEIEAATAPAEAPVVRGRKGTP